MGQQRVNEEGRKALLAARSGTVARRGKSSGGKGRKDGRERLTQVVTGFILGMLLGHAAGLLGVQSVPLLRGLHMAPAAGVAGALLALTPARRLLWWAGGALCALWLVLGYTPIMTVPVRSLVVRDRLERVEAVVVLSSDIHPSGALTNAAQTRLLKGYELLRSGYARTLVLTRLPRPKKSYVPAVREQLRVFGMDYPIAETGEVTNTHDEALKVSALARARGWKKVILVSDPTHMKRSKAVFARAGLPVICAPSETREYDLPTLENPNDRVMAFRSWLWEVVGYQVYRFRGWI